MKTKVLPLSAAPLAAFLLLAAILDRLLRLAGIDRWLLWGGLILLGVVATVLLFLHLRSRAGAAAPAADADLDIAFEAARKRLASAGVAGGRLSKLPVVLLLGPGGSTKTTTVLNAGIEPELLAGDASSPEAVTPTGVVNLWYAGGAVIVEAGGPVLEEEGRWNRLLQHLRPSRLAAALGRARQAPRSAVVCYSCEEFVRPGGAEASLAEAKKLRGRLAEVSRQLGIRLPVYVLFTKADRVAHFEDYVRGLTREEAQQLLGATLPLQESAAGAYADVEAPRLRDAFKGIFRSLAEWRLPMLGREGRELARTSGYEFPREVMKITGPAEQFLLELCRPSQLGINPFLRGFYFTGVRPIAVSDAAAEKAVAPAQQIALGATSVFRIQNLQGTPAPAPADTSSRRVPDWVFLRRLYGDVVLRDGVAREITGGGRRVDVLRRGLIGSAAALFLILTVGFIVSYANNRSLQREAMDALRGIEPVQASIGEAPSMDALARLDRARNLLARLGRYERERRPLGYAWGLYTGDRIRPDLRRAYFDRFESALWGGAREDLMASLERLPESPAEASAYGEAYDALKAHLVTSSYPHESSAGFLTPVVLRHWQLASTLEPEREDLVRRQLDFFGDELRYGNPYGAQPNEEIVRRTRAYLQRSTGTDQLYRTLLADASRGLDPVQFHRLHPGTEAVVRNPYTVQAAFTREGWAQVQTALGNIDQLLTREDWVAGERSVVPSQDRARLAQELRSRYVSDYVGAWREYLRAAEVVPFGGPPDAARKLAQLSGNESPLLQMLALASRHTAVDTLVVGRAFQPIHTVTPPADDGQVVSESNAGYLSALSMLQSSMDQVAQAAGPARLDALAQASTSADQVNLQVRQMAQGFSIQGDAREVGLSVQRLLQAPIAGAEGLARSLPAAETNAKGAAFCAPIRQLASRYPFSPTAASDASLDDVVSVLQPGGSVLWSFYDEVLQNLIVRQGSRYAARVGGEAQPTAAFVNFFNTAADVSAGLFPREGAGPQVTFALRPQTSDALPEVRVTVDGQAQAFTRTVAAARTFTWEMERARSARITGVTSAGNEVSLVTAPDGPWAVFRLLQAADWERTGNARYQLRWRIPTEPGVLQAELTFANPQPVFAPGYLQLNCVSQIVR